MAGSPELQSLLWVCVHPEVPNFQPGSHSLTLVRGLGLAGSHCGFTPSSPCPQADIVHIIPLVCLGCHVFLSFLDSAILYTFIHLPASHCSTYYSLCVAPGADGASVLGLNEVKESSELKTPSMNTRQKQFCVSSDCFTGYFFSSYPHCCEPVLHQR